MDPAVLENYQGSVAFLAAALALIAGFFLWRVIEASQRKAKHRDALREAADGDPVIRKAWGPDGIGAIRSSADPRKSSLNERVIAFVELQSTKAALGKNGKIPFARWMKTTWIKKHASHAGLQGRVNEEGFAWARIKLALTCGIAGCLCGCILSIEMAFLLAIVGAMIGLHLPKHAVKERTRVRSQEMEHHLPEMLDVMALGMRSGLSFDESLKMYSSHFKTMLADELANAQRQWSSGLERRDDALRKIASSYDSSVFSRVVEMIIRSIRFGSSMVESLEAAGLEARNAYKARREEEVAKAPVKMMIPTGTLILPAMLIMVLGPVLLELAGGDF